MIDFVMCSQATIEEIFKSDEVGRAFMYALINNMITDYNEIYKKDIINEKHNNVEDIDNYIICNIYYHNKNSLNVRCMNNGLYMDFSYSFYGFNNYNNLLTFDLSKDDVDNECRNIADKIYEHYNLITTANKTLEYCEDCKFPYSPIKKKGKLFSNYCEKCEIINYFSNKKYALDNNIQCDICYNTKFEKINDKIYDRPIIEICCCKNKNICLCCKSKLGEKNECPFCKQDLKTSQL